jgi:hypothetical protein
MYCTFGFREIVLRMFYVPRDRGSYWCIRDLKTALRHAAYTVLRIVPVSVCLMTELPDWVGFGATTALHDHWGITVCARFCIHFSRLARQEICCAFGT